MFSHEVFPKGKNAENKSPETVYQKYRKLAYNVAYSILNHPQDAEDAVQTAFVGILRNWENVKELAEEQQCSYVAISARRSALNLLKSQRKSVRLDDIQAVYHQSYPSLSPLAQALADLREDQREILLLRYDVGFSVKELAQHYQISEVTARQRIFRAKTELKKKMEEPK